MKSTFIAMAFVSFLTCPAPADGWLDYQKARIEAVGDEPTIEQLHTLAQLVASKSESDRAAIARELAWQKLQSIPDFPDRLRRNILESKAKWQAKETESGADYHKARSILAYMGSLPHPGVVEVLGEFLYDDELPGGGNTAEERLRAAISGVRPNCIHAMESLWRLIENPPIKTIEDDDGEFRNFRPDDVEIWKLWYEQVKAGNRTFRFKGDPHEYSLAGPVSEAKTPQANRGAKAAAPVVKSPVPASGVSGSLAVPVTLALAVGLLVVAAWRVARSRQS